MCLKLVFNRIKIIDIHDGSYDYYYDILLSKSEGYSGLRVYIPTPDPADDMYS